MAPRRSKAESSIYKGKTASQLEAEAHSEIKMRGGSDYWSECFLALLKSYRAYVKDTEGLRQMEMFTPPPCISPKREA